MAGRFQEQVLKSPRTGKRASGLFASGSEQASRRALWILGAFLTLLFLVGGSSWPHEAGLTLLRPLAILISAYGLATIKMEDVRPYRAIFAIFLLALALTSLHLVPLPPSVWQALPGREVIVEIDRFAGLSDLWRPLSMSPQGTLNALFSLSVPLAILALAPQLTLDDQCRLLLLLLCLSLASGLVVLLQAAGSDIALFPWTSETSGVFANRNHQAALLATAFPLLATSTYLAMQLGLNRRLALILAGSIGVSLIPLVIVTGSRAGLALSALAVALLPALRLPLFSDRRRRHSSRRRFAILAGAISTIGAMVLLTVFTARDVAISRLSVSGDEARFPMWNYVFHDLPSYLPWGSGVGTYIDVYQLNEPSELLRPLYSNHAHNDWLEILYTAGLPGAILAISAIFIWLAGAWQARRGRGIPLIISRTGLLMLLLLGLASVADYPVRTPLLSAVAALAAIWSASFRRFRDEA